MSENVFAGGESSIKSLEDLFHLMNRTKKARKRIVKEYLEKGTFSAEDFNTLKEAEMKLEKIEHLGESVRLSPDENSPQGLFDISYEENELKKDIFFLTMGEEEFKENLLLKNTEIRDEVREALRTLEGIEFNNFISDRDGPVNNYCSRYLSSVQSVYNSVFLCRFAKTVSGNTVIVTSAPLRNGGFMDVHTMPEGEFVLAGSMGREYVNKKRQVKTYPVKKERQKKLDDLNSRIADILVQPEYKKFSYIGSGFQQKYGQTTIARQDIAETIPEKESLEFLKVLKGVVNDIDPENKYLMIDDTGMDVEIILTVDPGGINMEYNEGGETKEFTKGDGIHFLEGEIPLDLSTGPNFICGDTSSDVPMLEAALTRSEDTYTIFVTQDQELRAEITELTDKAIFVSEPDVLVFILNELFHSEMTD
ncbi:MAG: trehalose 6-phosphate synthase [Chitinivibrionales bacterium]